MYTLNESAISNVLCTLKNERKKGKVKRISALILALLMVVCTLASCGAGNSEETEKKTDIYDESENTLDDNEKENSNSTSMSKESTAGLEFELNIDEKSYTVTGIGTCTATDIVIDNHKGLPVTSIGENAFYNCDRIKNITISNNVTSIGKAAFYGCTALTAITIPNGVTDIGERAFFSCLGLTSITVPDDVTSIGAYAFFATAYYNDESNWENDVLYIGDYLIEAKETISGSYVIKDGTKIIADSAFSYCSYLTGITIPEGITSVGSQAFHNCKKLANITLPDTITNIGYDVFDNTAYYNDMLNWENNVLYMGDYLLDAEMDVSGNYAVKEGTKVIADRSFYFCSRLTSITIPGSTVSIGDRAISMCDALINITVSEDNTAYKSIDGNLYTKDGKVLVRYAIGKKDTSFVIPDSVTNIGADSVASAYNLTSVTIGDSVKVIESSAFSNCSNLTCVTVGNSVTNIGKSAFNCCSGLDYVLIPDSVRKIGSYAFYECGSLTSITIPGSVMSIGDSAFSGCGKLANITVSEANTAYKSIDGNLYTADGKLLVQYAIGKEDASFSIPDSVTNIGTNSVASASNLTSVTIGDNVKIIGSYAFSGCSNLISVTVGNSVTSIETHAFEDCSALTSITIPASVTNISESAFHCRKLVEVINKSSIDITKGSDSNGNVAYYALEVHKEESKIVNKDGYLFYPYEGINYLIAYIGSDTILNLPENYNGEKYQINEYAFSGNDNITHVDISDGVTSIGNSAFSWCYGLTSVTIGSGVISIGDSAFYCCNSLTSVIVSDNITSIGDEAFYWCCNLTSVTIPESVTSIGCYAFSGCYNLTNIEFKNTEGWWYASNSDAMEGSNISSVDLANKAIAAEYLTSIYNNYYWKRSATLVFLKT